MESVLTGHPAVREALVVAREFGAGDVRLVAYVVAGADEPGAGELIGYLKERLPEYMVPAAFVTLPALPLTPNGKVDRAALPEPELARPELHTPFVAPRDDLERSIAQVWCELLGVERVGADDNFWENLAAAREGITFASDEELLAAGVRPALLRADGYVKAKGVLPDADLFDAGFFGFSPREAEILDPQHRVLLECAWHALESAGCDPRGFPGRIGVFAGTSLNSYLLFNLMANARAVDSAGSYQTLIASDKDFLATRVSYKLDLRGPSVTVQTACSTSLTAVHLACQSLLDGDCDIALAGGVSVRVPLAGGYRYEPGWILPPAGLCRTFVAVRGGTVPGNGVGVVVLRRLTDARDSGDRIAP